MIIKVYIDGATKARLEQASQELGRTIEDLAEAAVSEAALDYAKHKARSGLAHTSEAEVTKNV